GISMLFNEVTSCLPQSCSGGDTCRIPDCRAVVYMPMERMTARTLRKYHELKVKGVSQFMAPYEIRYPGKLFTKNRRNTDMALSMWQQNYVLAQYLWSPETDFDTFFEDMGSKYYGRAWKQLKEIRLILFDLFEKGPHMFSGVPPQALGEMMSRPGAVEKIEKLFDEAEKAVKDSPLHLRRTEQERDYYNESLLKMYKWHKKNAKPALTLPKISSSLKIDGALTESTWKNAPMLTGFLIRDTGKKQKAAFQVKAKYLCNEKYLYFGVEAKDPESKQLSAYTKTPSIKIYQDAYLDLFIKEPNGRDFYYQFTINPAGVCLEYTRNSGTVGKQISAGTLVKTKVLDDRVIFEIAIPVSKLNGKNLSGNKWKINIGWAPKLTGDMNRDRDPERKALCLGTDFHLSYLDFVVK
ncbi:MAG: hypothetical protein J6S58_11010, partial [Lentisphaeria bacterium]|nr:hypothetical protein [Lentisphaeria bacterium]